MRRLKIDQSKLWTRAEFDKLGEEFSCQIINGILYDAPTPPLSNQLVKQAILSLLFPFDRDKEVEVLLGPLDMHIDDINILKPDLMVIKENRFHIIQETGLFGAPDLLIEVTSPYSGFLDRNAKKKLYQQVGVTEYWIVDPANKTLEIYVHDQLDIDVPTLYLVEEGMVESTVLHTLSFDVKEIFKNRFNL